MIEFNQLCNLVTSKSKFQLLVPFGTEGRSGFVISMTPSSLHTPVALKAVIRMTSGYLNDVYIRQRTAGNDCYHGGGALQKA